MSKNLIHNVNDDIAEYQTALESLRKAFEDESKISTELIGYRVWKSVLELGVSYACFHVDVAQKLLTSLFIQARIRN